MENETIIETKGNLKNGQQFCPNCGANAIYFEPSIGKLFCPYCESVFDGKKLEETPVNTLEGNIIGTGAQRIEEGFNNIVTVRCNGCGAEVIIDTTETTVKRCHWCRGILSINERIPNGAVPDVILPFQVSKEEAKKEIDKFVQSRTFFALPRFKGEYKIDNIMGVYLPYMLIDANITCNFEGIGEKLIATHGSGNSKTYEANAYKVRRTFNMTIEDLTMETSSDKINKEDTSKTNNIINSIMPFDTENCIRFQSNYLTGFTSEKRDTNVGDLNDKALTQIKDVARHALNNELRQYDRGIRWDKEEVNVIGTRWISAYLPVWIYSYYQKNNKQLHYVAVNGRTKELMGSIPINKSGLFTISTLIELIALIISLYIINEYGFDRLTFMISFFLCTSGIIFYKSTYKRYRNDDARHKYEKDTNTTLEVLFKTDNYITTRRGLRTEKILGQNNTRIDGDKVKIVNQNSFVDKAVDKLTRNNY
jgi:ribosomal protein S27E